MDRIFSDIAAPAFAGAWPPRWRRSPCWRFRSARCSRRAAPAPYTVVETGQGYARLQQAVDAIGGGKGTITVAAGRHADCAVQSAGEVAYVAAEPGAAVFDGTTCEGKAALVLRGRAAEVSGLVFQNMRVADFNGAGIRLEKGDLTVAESWFRDSQQGILTAADPAGRIVVDRSTFTRLGTCEGPAAARTRSTSATTASCA